MAGVSIWDELGPEERVVLDNALEEAYLNGVIGDFLGHAEAGEAVWMFSTDTEAMRALIPRLCRAADPGEPRLHPAVGRPGRLRPGYVRLRHDRAALDRHGHRPRAELGAAGGRRRGA